MIRKDIVFFGVLLVYLLFICFNVFVKTVITVEFFSITLVVMMIPLIIAKTVSSRFNKWLETEIKKQNEG